MDGDIPGQCCGLGPVGFPLG